MVFIISGISPIKSIIDCENINSANPLYLIIEDVDGLIECSSTEENNGSKYLTFASSDKNKKVLKDIRRFGIKLNIM